MNAMDFDARMLLSNLPIDELLTSCSQSADEVLRLASAKSLSDDEKAELDAISKRMHAAVVVMQARLFVMSNEFLKTYAWKRLRMDVLERDKGACQCCGRTRSDGVVMNVDHIIPRIKRPELALVVDNLQVLCADCNHGKGNRTQTNWTGN